MHFDDSSHDLKAEIKKITDGRQLSPFDKEVVSIVASLTIRARDARERIDRDGSIIDDGKGFPVEHPALLIEKRASMELRGWVKDRPDLFGEKKSTDSGRPRRAKFEVVN